VAEPGTGCECHSALHPAEGCGQPAASRWYFPPVVVYPGEPGHIDLCGGCQAEWEGHHLTPRLLVSLACTCLLGHTEEHLRGECPCTTTVMDCVVHADGQLGRTEAELVTQHVMVPRDG
jgi:hypothetical protein